MARVVFVQPDPFPRLGVMQLCAVLQHRGHGCDLRIGRRPVLPDADLLAVSLCTGHVRWFREWASKLSRPRPMIVAGGPHPTFAPEDALDSGADYVVRGEGETALAALVESIANNRDDEGGLRGIPNLSFRLNVSIEHNLLGPLADDLDSLPMPCREIYFQYKPIHDFYVQMFPVITSRGCPMDCAFCFNAEYRRIVRGLGPYVRRRSARNVLDEVNLALDRYKIRGLKLEDDEACSDAGWLAEYVEGHRSLGGPPVVLNSRAGYLTGEVVRMLARLPARTVIVGLETGSERLRTEVLNKRVHDRELLAAAHLLKAAGIALQVDVMFGLPGETLEDGVKTVTMARRMAASFVHASMLQAYPGTRLSLARADLPDGTAPSYYRGGSNKNGRRAGLRRLAWLAQALAYRKTDARLMPLLARLPLDPLYAAIFAISYVRGQVSTKGISWSAFARFSIMARRFWFGGRKRP